MLNSIVRAFLLIAVVSAVISVSVSFGARAETQGQPPVQGQSQTILRLANEYPATTATGEADKRFAEGVAARTGGTVRIELGLDGKFELKTADQLKAVADKRVDLASSFLGALGPHEPLFLLSALPFLTRNTDDARKLYQIARPYYEQAFARHNQRMLYVVAWPPAGIWAKEPVKDRVGLARLKIRTFDDISSEVMNRIGATAASISFSEAQAKLASGDINAVLSSGDGGAGRRLWQHLPHFTEITYGFPISVTTINTSAFDTLTASEREALVAVADEISESQWGAMIGRVERNYAVMRENGVTISRVPAAIDAELRAAAQTAIDAWTVKVGPDAKTILSEFR